MLAKSTKGQPKMLQKKLYAESRNYNFNIVNKNSRRLAKSTKILLVAFTAITFDYPFDILRQHLADLAFVYLYTILLLYASFLGSLLIAVKT